MRQLALVAMCEPDPEKKVALADVLHQQLAIITIAYVVSTQINLALPGRRARPTLTHPAKVPRRSPLTLNGCAAILHAICHMERHQTSA